MVRKGRMDEEREGDGERNRTDDGFGKIFLWDLETDQGHNKIFWGTVNRLHTTGA